MGFPQNSGALRDSGDTWGLCRGYRGNSKAHRVQTVRASYFGAE